MELLKGRPIDIVGRSAVEIATYDKLDQLEIEYFRVDHEHAETMEACKEIDVCLGVKMCKNLFLCNRQKTAFYLLMIPGDKPFITKEFSRQMEISRVSFASGEHMKTMLDIEPGSLSVLGLMNDTDNKVHLCVDKAVIEKEFVGCHPCVNTSSLKIKTDDLMKFLKQVNHDYTLLDLPYNA